MVVFETLYHDNKEVAVHADITDKDQTVEFEEPDKPQIKTKATVDGEKEVDPLEKVTLIDTVTYSNLTPGKTYTVKGVLMDKSTGKKLLIDGKEVTAETEFTPDKANGSVDLSFTFDTSSLAGKSVVAFETLYHENIEVAVHADLDDDDQTVVIRQPTEVIEDCEQNIPEPDDGERKAEVNFDLVRELMSAKAKAPPHIVKGIDAMVLMAKGYTCREIGKRMNARDNLVSAYVSKARRYLRNKPQAARMMETYAA